MNLPITKFEDIDLAKPGTYLVEIDPYQAMEILDKLNWHNRNFKAGKISAYGRDMIADNWVFNGDPIRFSIYTDGSVYLSDGQNRLQSQVNSETTQQWIVVTGLPHTAQETMDRGASRTSADAARLRGIPHGPVAMGISTRALTYDQGLIISGRYAPSLAEQITYYTEHEQAMERAVEVAGLAFRLPVSRVVTGTAFHLCARLDEGGAEKFYVEQFVNAVGLAFDDPASALTRRLQNIVNLAPGNAKKAPPDVAFRYMILAWNAFREGRKLNRLVPPRGGWESETLRFK